MNIKFYWKHMGFIMKTIIYDVSISPLRGLIVFVEDMHRAMPDVKIFKAYGLSLKQDELTDIVPPCGTMSVEGRR
jgi:hypothetical protein